ncbi:MAG: NAD(P)-dependent oxidoreductase [Candidatus Saccharimonadales bacterium]
MPTVLITDSLFFFQEHEKQLKDAGFDFERLDKPDASEEELIRAVKGKVGYLFGGIEHVTEKVIDAADELKVIAFTGIDFKGMIPSWEYATQKGIAITNIPEGPTNEVSEWAITAALMMNRHFLELGRVGKDIKFAVTKGLEGQKVGIVGLGHIGTRITEMIKTFRPKSISYYSLHRHEDKETEMAISYLELSELLNSSDVVFLCVDGSAKDMFGIEQFNKMKQDSLLVNITHPGVINEVALLDALTSQRIRAVSDHPMEDERFNGLPLDRWYCMNTSNTITEAGAKLMSDKATTSLINVLTKDEDTYIANPIYKEHAR